MHLFHINPHKIHYFIYFLVYVLFKRHSTSTQLLKAALSSKANENSGWINCSYLISSQFFYIEHFISPSYIFSFGALKFLSFYLLWRSYQNTKVTFHKSTFSETIAAANKTTSSSQSIHLKGVNFKLRIFK